MKASPVFWNEIFVTLASRVDLTSEQARWAMRRILSGETPHETIKTFLIGIQAKGEKVCEIEGFLSAMLEESEKISVPELFVDPTGTGGMVPRPSTSRLFPRLSLIRRGSASLNKALDPLPPKVGRSMFWRP